MHARESGYKSNIYRDENRTTRNSDIRSYKKAIEYLISQNYIIVRMGDESMSIVAEFEADFKDNYFDYAHSKLKSNLMDTYLFSRCEFSIVC
ncbi:TIGR04372 family glycosyltransferase, partial [Mesorhizobium japonicum]|uniref:TIGR04372 family glycosyltransferase n=1 Tax=Mesorhizobium japonicum TaxID=2066070 RepID=UPI003B5C79E9